MGLDIVELVMAVETTFDLQIADADAARLTTVGDLYDYLGRRMVPDLVAPGGGPYEGDLWERYLDVVERETGVRRDRLRPHAQFVRDLNLD